MESLAFEYADDIAWWCIKGGTQKLVKGMEEKSDGQEPIENKILMGKEVVSVAYDEKAQDELKMKVIVRGEEEKPRHYATCSTQLRWPLFSAWTSQTSICPTPPRLLSGLYTTIRARR